MPAYGTYKPAITVGIGNLKPLEIGFDTGSSGLHVFADANLEALGSDVQFTSTPTSVTYGNPGRITFHGVVCHARLRFGDFTTPTPVPLAYLTSASLPKTNPNGKLPDLRSYKAMHSYGVFGAGLTGRMFAQGNVPNPFLTLPGRRGSSYSIRLTQDGGEVVLGSKEPVNSTAFPLTPGTLDGTKWTLGPACLFVNGRAIGEQAVGKLLLVSFDTGNGVPWLHTANTNAVPQTNGFVTPATRIGVGPPGSTREAASVVAGTAFANKIKVVETAKGSPLINVGIQAFFGHIVTYDNTRGTISFAPVTAAPVR